VNEVCLIPVVSITYIFASNTMVHAVDAASECLGDKKKETRVNHTHGTGSQYDERL